MDAPEGSNAPNTANGEQAPREVPANQFDGLFTMDEEDGVEATDGGGGVGGTPEEEVGDGKDTDEDDDNAVAGTGTRHGRVSARPTYSAPRAKTTAQRKITKGGKSGNPGNFQGEPLLFLKGLLTDYNTIQAQADGRGKLDRLDAFWTRLRQSFWEKFTASEFCDVFKETDKTRLVDKVNKALKGWFRYQSKTTAAAGKNGKNPWARLMRELYKQQPKKPPKHLAGWQYWAKLHKDEVAKVVGRGAGIDEWNKAARELYMQLEDAEKEEMVAQCAKIHEDAVERFNDPLDGLPSADSADWPAARDQMAAVVVPMLDLISQYTGLKCLSLIGACRDEVRGEGFVCHAIHYGETDGPVPKNLATFDPQKYAQFAQYFCSYAQHVGGNADVTSGTEPISTPREEPDQPEETEAPPRGDLEDDLPPPTRSPAHTSRTPSTPTPEPVPTQANTNTRTTSTKSKPRPRKRSKFTLCAEKYPTLAFELEHGLNKEELIGRLRGLSDMELEWEENQAARLAAAAAARKGLTGITARNRSRANTSPERDEESRPPVPDTPAPTPPPAHTPEPTTPPSGTAEPVLLHAHTPDPDLPASPNTLPDTAQQPTSLADSIEADTLPSLPVPPHASTGADADAIPHGDVSAPELAMQPPTADMTVRRDGASKTPPPSPQNVPEPLVLDVSDTPAWLQAQYHKFTDVSIPPETSATWNAAVADWVRLERTLNFSTVRFVRYGDCVRDFSPESQKVGLAATSRPANVSLWIQNARNGLIVLKKKEDYAQAWWAWWSVLNPPWRERVEGRPAGRESGDWSSLFKAGTNGFVNILMALIGLQEAAIEEEWREALADVAWVLQEVRAAAEAQQQSASSAKRPLEAPESSGPSRTTKRAKRGKR